MSQKIGFVGLGRMGANMARRLKDEGFNVSVVFDIQKKVANALAKEIGAGAIAETDECVVLFSEETGHDLGGGFDSRSLGSHTLRGRAAPVEVFQLLSAPA